MNSTVDTMSTPALVFDTPEFSEYSPQSVILPGRREFHPGETQDLLDENENHLGKGRVVGYCTAPFDNLPEQWTAAYHLPHVETRYGLADELEERWDGFNTRTLCTLVLLEVEIEEYA